MMFDMFLQEQSMHNVAIKLNKMGLRTQTGREWTKCALSRVFRNRVYIGEVFYKGEVYPGEQEAIVDRGVWEKVQELLTHNRRYKGGRPPNPRFASLKGVIRCGYCNGPMTPTHSTRWGRTYFYYQCYEDSKREVHTCPIRIVPASEIEKAVVKNLGQLFSTPTFVSMVSTVANIPIKVVRNTFKDIDSFWNDLIQEERTKLIHLLVQNITVKEDGIAIKIRTEGMRGLIKEMQDDND